MEIWSTPNAFSPATFKLGDLIKVIRVFNAVEPVIKMHAYSNSDIQSGIITSLDTWYEQISKDWFDRTRRTYILIYLTVALTVLRGALIEVDYDLTSHQILVYCSVLVPVLWIAFDIFWGREILRVYNAYAEAYETYSEFYQVARVQRKRNINVLRNIITKQRRRVMYQAVLWIATVVVSVIITLLKLK